MILSLKTLRTLLKIETDPQKVLDTQLLLENIIKTDVYCKANKFPVHWKSKIPKTYKRNAISGDLDRSWRISSNFYHENEIRNFQVQDTQ